MAPTSTSPSSSDMQNALTEFRACMYPLFATVEARVHHHYEPGIIVAVDVSRKDFPDTAYTIAPAKDGGDDFIDVDVSISRSPGRVGEGGECICSSRSTSSTDYAHIKIARLRALLRELRGVQGAQDTRSSPLFPGCQALGGSCQERVGQPDHQRMSTFQDQAAC